MSAHRATVVVPLYNGRDLLPACLESIPDDAEIVVVDDGSTDGAPELVEERFPRARLLRNGQNFGFAATANRGLAVARRPVRLVLNSDARLRPGALEALVAAFDRPDVGIAGPRLVFADGTHQVSAASFPTVGSFVTGSFILNEAFRRLFPNRRFGWELGMTAADHEHDRDVDWVMGAAIAVHERCLADVGGLDEGYRMYVEECDLCWRAREAGWAVRYVAAAEVVHLGGGSGGDPAREARLNIAGEARLMARSHGRDVLPRWRAARLSSSLVKAVVFAALGVGSARMRDRARWHLGAVRALVSRDVRAAVADADRVLVGRAGRD